MNSNSIVDNRSLNTGINESSPSNSFVGQAQVFPNPTRDVLNIDYSMSANAQVQFEITDINGGKINSINKSASQGENQIKLDVARFGPGFYFINILSGDERQTKKIVVIR